MRISQVYNPYRLFTGNIIPEWLSRVKTISLGAKVVYARLARYAGENGLCYPAVDTLADEIGIGARQAQRYIAELEQQGIIRRVKRFSDKGQSSNAFEFLWHPLIEDRVSDVSSPPVSLTPPGVTDMTPTPVSDMSPKENHVLRESLLNKNRAAVADFDDWMNQEPTPQPEATAPASPIVDDYVARMEAKHGAEWRIVLIRQEAEAGRKEAQRREREARAREEYIQRYRAASKEERARMDAAYTQSPHL